ncbi:type III-B CRISPR module-associated protein Cmr5 [Dactylosporangium sp. NPDC049525]|uniref:type III-B CRISPR module-associated protein Cmr5 n=1 Tax=Dactylosporangium sp. NPDC049525 TaxID=3154730 RepID=UPI003441C13A
MSPRRFDLTAAADAERALAAIAGGKPVPGEILTRLKGLPALLRASGVPAVLAFFGAKAGPATSAPISAQASGSDPGAQQLASAYRKVRHALVEQLTVELGWAQPPTDIYGQLAALPAADLARAYRRLEAYAGWLRRLAEATEQAQTEQAQTEQPTAPAPTGPTGG